jgi:hypothetical protein
VKSTPSNRSQYWAFVCIVDLALLAGCGSESASGKKADAAVDAAVDAGSVVEAGPEVLTTEQKTKVCQAKADQPLLRCGCQYCPTTVYDCYYADGEVAAACRTVIGCVISSGCSDSAACTKACSAVIEPNIIGMQVVLALENCIVAQCSSEIAGLIDAGARVDGAAKDGSLDVATTEDSPPAAIDTPTPSSLDSQAATVDGAVD